MAWTTPTLRGLVTSVVQALNGNLTGADAALARNNLAPTAKVIGGHLFELHRFAAWAADQRFVLTCDDDQLDRHGAEMKPPVPRKPAAPARGAVTVTAATAVTLATGAILARSDGATYAVDAGIVLSGAGTASVNVTAVVAGADGATAAASALTVSSGLTGTATFAVGAGGLGGAADAETNDAYRARLLFAKAYPEHGGAPADWLRYTLAVPGVTRAFVDPLAYGRGTVVIYPFFDTTRPNGIGLESDRAAVAAALAVARPGAGLPVVWLPQAVPVDITITGVSPATPEVFTAISAEITRTFAANSRVAGLSAAHPSMPFLATPASFSRSWIWQAAANATGEERHSVVSPSADIALTAGQTAVPGTITLS